MKSEERHQLEQNELADWLTKLIGRGKQYVPHVAAAVVLLFAVMWVYGLIAASRENKRGEAWRQFFDAQTPEQIEVVSERHPGADLAPYAKLKIAQMLFQDGKAKLFNDRNDAVSKLDKATKAFEEVAAKAEFGSLLKSQALFGIAVCKETTGAINDAIAAYKRVIADCKDSGEAAYAERQLKLLESPEGKDFYAKVANYRPKATSTDLPPKVDNPAAVPFPVPDAIKSSVPPVPPKDAAPPLPKAEPTKSDSPKPATDKPADNKPTAKKAADGKSKSN